MTKKTFNALGDCPPLANDCFVRYFFTDKGGEKVLLDFINAVMISADMKTFKAVEIFKWFYKYLSYGYNNPKGFLSNIFFNLSKGETKWSKE